jgi:hypothetical protein
LFKNIGCSDGKKPIEIELFETLENHNLTRIQLSEIYSRYNKFYWVAEAVAEHPKTTCKLLFEICMKKKI